jgi:hypothetical protein
MQTDRIDEKMAEMLEKAAAAPGPELRERAIEAMSGCRPRKAPSRLRVLAAAVGAAVALVGLGFVRFPGVSTKGTLGRAIAALERAPTIHITACAPAPKGTIVTEEWWSKDGFYRYERWQDSRLETLNLDDGEGGIIIYNAWSQEARESEGVPLPWQPLPPLAEKSQVAKMFSFIQSTVGWPVRERLERSLYGGAVAVIEAEGVIPAGHGRFRWRVDDVGYSDGDRVKVRAEVQPYTGRLLSMQQYKLEDGTWRPTYWTERVEWDVEIPQSAREFHPPQGTTLRREAWWLQRAHQTIESGSTRDWDVTLNAIDVNRRGDLVLSLRRELRSEATLQERLNSAVAMRVEAVDDTGARYTQLDRYGCYNYLRVGYWTTTLERGEASRQPKTVTLTIHPYPEDVSEAQSVTFRDLPLPPRQDAYDVIRESCEVIQY